MSLQDSLSILYNGDGSEVINAPDNRMKQVIISLSHKRTTWVSTADDLIKERTKGLMANTQLSGNTLTAPYICMTHSQYIQTLIQTALSDLMLEQTINQVTAAIKPTEDVKTYIIRILADNNIEALHIADVFYREWGASLNRYIMELCKQFMLWYITLGCIPFTFIPSDVLSDTDFQYNRYTYTHKCYNIKDMQTHRITEATIQTKLYTTIKKVYSKDSVLTLQCAGIPTSTKTVMNAPFFCKMGISLPSANILADILQETMLPIETIYKLILLMKSFTSGMLPYIPILDSNITIIHDTLLNICLATDNSMVVYDVYNIIPCASLHKNSLLQSNACILNHFKTLCTHLLDMCITQTERTALLSRIDHPTTHKHTTDEVQSLAFPNTVFNQTGDKTARYNIVNQYLATREDSSVLSTFTNSFNIDTNALYKAHQLETITAFEELIVDHWHNAKIKETLDTILTAVTTGNHNTGHIRAHICALPYKLRLTVEHIIDALDTTDTKPCTLTTKPGVKMLPIDANNKMVCQFESPNPMDMLKDAMYMWALLWKNIITGQSHYPQKNVIDYQHKDTVAEADRYTLIPHITIRTVWNWLLEQTFMLIPFEFSTTQEHSVDDIIKIIHMLPDAEKIILLRKKFCLNTAIKTQPVHTS